MRTRISELILSVAALATASTFATAADLPVRAAPRPLPAVAPAFTWTGFYLGVNAGVTVNSLDSERNSVRLPSNSLLGSEGTNGTLTFTNGRDDDRIGAAGGGQIGYNWQAQPGTGFVLGIEADIQAIDLNTRGVTTSSPSDYTFVPSDALGLARGLAFAPRPPATVVSSGTRGLDYFGTVRGRLGYAFDRILIYGTGGFAYGGEDTNSNDTRFGVFSRDRTSYGYAAGAGVEVAVLGNVTFKVEGLYVSLENDGSRGTSVQRGVYDRPSNTVFLNSNGSNDGNEFSIFRAGVNYKF